MNFPMHLKTNLSRVLSCLLRQLFRISMIICNGGTMFTAPIGNTLWVREVISKERKIIPSYMLRGKMLRLMQNGPAKDYPPRQNGSLLREVEMPAIFIHGEINSHQMENGWLTFTKASFLKMIMARTDLRA